MNQTYSVEKYIESRVIGRLEHHALVQLYVGAGKQYQERS